MKDKIKLGYEVGSGEIVNISPSHLIVTGITQLSGKTTTLEALIHRSGFKANVFKTKIGEKSFTHGTETAPFFRDRSDYEFVRSLIEAYAREKLVIEKGTLMNLCKGSNNLIEIKRRVDEAIAGGKLRGIKEEIHTRLRHYLENLIPQIQYASFSNTLNLVEGINIMNLERFTEEAQSLIIQAVADEVLKTQHDTIIVIPEAWKFIPQKYNNPCKRTIESYIRQGAANKNFIWIDSQDMAGVDKLPLKSISTWILGYQAERNEVSHTLDQINIPKKNKPKEDEIMSLQIGHFFISSQEGVKKVYVQPVWMNDEDALQIAKGEKEINDVQQNSSLTQKSVLPAYIKEQLQFDPAPFNKKIIELRGDFFNKIQELVTDISGLREAIWKLDTNKQQVDIDELLSLVLQKMPVSAASKAQPVDVESIVKIVISRIPKSGNVVYEIAPIEKIKKDFLEAAKNKILEDINSLGTDAKKSLKFLESQGKAITNNFIVEKCFHLLGTNSSHRGKIANAIKELSDRFLVDKDAKTGNRPRLKTRIKELLSVNEASEQEMETVYNHIMTELI